jgi:C-terminal processing protease CtpA/Prc
VTNSHRAAIGAQVGTVTGRDGAPAGTGIVNVTSGGPAEHAGLRCGDIIQAADGPPTRTPKPSPGCWPPRTRATRSPSRSSGARSG